jgi:hypothetical protein
MYCRDVRELADSFLTGQLLIETNHEVVRHLETCPDCRAEIAARRTLRDALRRGFDASGDLAPRPAFAAELKDRLRAPGGPVSRRSLLQSWWALAAGVVLAAGGGLAVRGARSRSRLTTLARQAAGDHQNCAVKFALAERPISLPQAARLYGDPYGALATFEPSALDPALQTLERHACVYQGRRFGHLVFRSRGALTSLLVTDGPPPSEVGQSSDHGPAVAFLPAGRFAAFVVADTDGNEVLRVAALLSEPLSRHLA